MKFLKPDTCTYKQFLRKNDSYFYVLFYKKSFDITDVKCILFYHLRYIRYMEGVFKENNILNLTKTRRRKKRVPLV